MVAVATFVLLLVIAAGLLVLYIKSHHLGPLLGGLVTLVAAGIMLLFNMFTTVDTGHIMVTRWFGAMQPGYYPEGGPYFINPILGTKELSIRPTVLSFTGDSRINGVSRNQVRLDGELVVSYALTAPFAWKVYQKLGQKGPTVDRFVESAVRSCMPQQDWEEEITEQGRTKLSDCTAKGTLKQIEDNLVTYGFTPEEAKGVYLLSEVSLKQVVPTDARILTAIGENRAASIELDRQHTLTKVAEQVALRQEQEGVGIRKMMEALPKSNSISDMAAVLHAIADKERADAMTLAVQKGNPNLTIVTGNSTPSIAIPPARPSTEVPPPVRD